jgi:N-methylhydantoinase A
MAAELRIGVDTGGTFTDLILAHGGDHLITHKLPSTPEDPARAVLAGIESILGKYAQADHTRPFVIHGSTVATNALLEGKGARAAFITTAGFEDTLHIGRQNRPELYALEVQKPQPPVECGCCLGADERVTFEGKVLRELSSDSIRELMQRLVKLDVESVAISLFHSYANPAHECAIADAIRRELPGVHLTVSSELLPEFREYERASTCVVNAVVAPVMAVYVGSLARELGSEHLRIMASAGGSLPESVISHSPVHTILSGPAGGVVGAYRAAQAAGEGRVITFDMGGTSTDVSLCDGGLSRTTDSEIAGLPIRLPMIDIHTVGAGGGSVAWVDDGGALHVGPESMGADPGPACYGKQQGELRATVTDAHAVLGHLPPDTKLAGEMPIDHTAACDAVGGVASQTGLSLHEAAHGILRVAEATMARAIQRISVERGHDPRGFVLMSFGGAGGLHAASLATQLGIRRVLVPRDPGLLSALGMLQSAPLYNFSQAVMARVPGAAGDIADLAQLPAVAQALDALTQQAQAALDSEGVPLEQRVVKPALDLRYCGQSFELAIPLDGGDTLAAFREQHAKLYGYNPDDKELEVVAARMQATAQVAPLRLPELAQRSEGSVSDVCQDHAIHGLGGQQPCQLVAREDLQCDDNITGPAVISEYSATTLVPQGWRCEVTALGFLVLEREAAEGADGQ